MKPCSLLLFLSSITIAHSASSQEMKPMDNATEFITKLKERSKQTNTIIADFVEEKYMSYLKEPQKSAGIFYYKKEDKLRWEKNTPLKYIFIADGEEVKIQDNGKEMNVASAKQIVGKIKDLILILINGEFNSGKVFTSSYFQSTETYFVKLIPKGKKLSSLYEYITLSFSKETLLLKELVFYEKSGDKSTMTFSNSKTNQVLEDALFIRF